MATASGSLQAQSITASGLSERQITQDVVTYNRPLDNSPNIYYDDLDLVVAKDPAPFLEGKYLITDAAFTVDGYGDLTANSSYRVWEIDNGNSTYDIFIYNTTWSEWDVYPDQTASITTKTASDKVSPNLGYDVSQINQNQSYTQMSPSFTRSVITVSGIAERSMTASGTLSAQQSSISALAEREVPAPNGALVIGLSSTTGTSERTITGSGILNDDDANVVGGFAEREVFQLLPPGSGNFRPTEYHLVTGVAELKKVATGINMPDDDSVVSGVGSKGLDATGALEFTDNDSIVVGKGGIGYEATGVLESSESTVVGAGERKITASGDLVTGDSTVSGVSERIVVEVEADLTADEVGVVAITGESERIIVGSSTTQAQSSAVVGSTVIKSNGTGTLQPSDDSSVAGVSEREIVASGTLVVDDESTVSGVSEREITGSGTLADDSSTVTGSAINAIVGSGALVVQATLFPATGFAERSITGSGAATQTSNSVVAGVGENEVTSESGHAHAGLSTVTATVEITGKGTGTPKAQVSTVAGVAERIIDINIQTQFLMSDDASVAGVAERQIDATGALQTGSSTVSGVSERTITGNGVLTQTTDSTVVGAAENQIDYISGIEQVGPSTIVGLSERTITGSGATQQTNDSVIVGASERTNNASGTLTTGESTVVGATEITHNRLPDINGYPHDEGDTAFGPDSTDSKVDYVSRPQSYAPRYLKLSGTSNVNRDGVYDVLISGFTVAESGLNYTTTPSTTYNVYYKVHNASTMDVVVYNTTRSAWYVTTISSIDDFFTGFISNATVSQENLVSTNSIVPYGIEFDPLDAEPSEVVGLSERIVVGTGALEQSVHSRVVGVSERENVAGTGSAIDALSTVVGLALIGRVTSPELNTVSDSLVDGLSERIVTVDAGITQVDASVVAGVAERIITGEGTLEQTTDAVVAGVAERIITVDAGIDMPDDDSKVVGVAERIVTVDAGIEQVDVSVVAGVAERIVVLESGIDMPDDDSKIVGVSERVITGAGDLVPTTNNLVNGVAEVIKVATGINMPDDDSKVNGVAERIIGKFILFNPKAPDNLVNGLAERTVENNNITLQCIAPDNLVNGLAERQINLLDGIFSADSDQEQSRVGGIVERQIDAFGILQDSDSTVFGVAERVIENNEITQALKPTDNNIVAGEAERIVVLQEGIDMPDDDSKIVGVAERTVVDVDATPQAPDNLVNGVAERTITGQGDLVVPDVSKVFGVAEREVENNEISQDLKPTDNNLVTGVAERIINLLESPQAQDAHMGQDEVITIDRHPIGGTEYPEYRSDLYAGDAQPALDADRVHTQETDGESTKLRFGPNSSDPNVVYINPKYLRLQGNSDPANDGVYDLLDTGFTCSVSGGNNLTLTENKNYNVYYRKVGYQDYRVCMFRTTNLTWVAFQTTLNPELFFTTGVVITNGQLNGELIASTSQSRGGPYKIMRPTLYNLVVGDADRVSDINDVTPVLKPTENNIVEGVAVRKVKPSDGALHAQPSRIVGIAERTVYNAGLGQQVASGPSTVVGDVERVIPGAGVLVSGQSSLGGLAENQIDLEEGIAQVGDASVTAVVERTVVNIPDYDIVVEGSGSSEEFTVYYPEARINGSTEITYDGNDIVLSGTALNNGTFVFTGQTYQVATSSGNYSNNPDYMVFEKDNGNGTYDIIAITSGTLRWTVFGELTESVLDKSHGDSVGHSYSYGLWTNSTQRTVTHGTPDTVTPTSKVEAGYSELHGEVTLYPEVEVIRKATGAPQADSSTVNGYGPRTSKGIGVLECSVSQVVATDDRVSVGVPGKVNPKAGPSTVTATVDRTVHGVDGTVASDPSTVDGSGFRTSKGSGELLDEHDHLVDGVAERVITATGNLETEDSQVVGEAHKIVHVVQGIAQVSSSRVEGVAERSITVEAELQAGDSKVHALVYTNNTEQQAMHVQRAFRIRKPHTRRIIVRQTPTNRL